jgi:hypothetical protein
MFLPSKRVFNVYKLLVFLMVEDNVIFYITKTNNKLLCDVETLLGMAYVLPLLEVIQRLSKHLFICEFFFLSSNLLKPICLLCIVTPKRGIHQCTFLCSLISLNTSMILCA